MKKRAKTKAKEPVVVRSLDSIVGIPDVGSVVCFQRGKKMEYLKIENIVGKEIFYKKSTGTDLGFGWVCYYCTKAEWLKSIADADAVTLCNANPTVEGRTGNGGNT